ncbi:hypothetical protein GCM10018952_12430 [Streptosporangium vulgare]
MKLGTTALARARKSCTASLLKTSSPGESPGTASGGMVTVCSPLAFSDWRLVARMVSPRALLSRSSKRAPHASTRCSQVSMIRRISRSPSHSTSVSSAERADWSAIPRAEVIV